MAASALDKFQYTGNPGTATTLSAPGYTIGNASINVASTTNFPTATGVIFGIDTAEVVNGEEVRVDGSYCVFTGTVTSATAIGNLTLLSGTPQNYAAGALTRVYITVSSMWTQRLIEGLLAEHSQLDGTHTDITADSIVVAGTIEAEEFVVTGAGGDAGWLSGLPAPDTVTYNGNRSYDLVFNATDLTDTVYPGMRVRTARTVTAPTQCTDLEASSSQYYTKTTPAGTTFTDDFCAGGWVKIESIGAISMIVSRYNGTSGWELFITATGSVCLQGNNAGAGNWSKVESAQSIPLGKWVHVTAQLDMSAFTATSTTSYVMIDGVDVPSAVSRLGTNPTALVQAGNLEVGSWNGGALPFDGKLAQVFYSSAKITQANMRTLSSQGITPALISTHNIVSAYSFDGSITDLNTTNANNLTANGGAVATNADSPFALGSDLASAYTDGTRDFGVITKAAFSTDTTLTVQVPESCTIPTSGGVSAIVYSREGSPYGFPSDQNKWSIVVLSANERAFTATTFTNLTDSITVPVGSWLLKLRAHLVASPPTNPASSRTSIATLSTSNIAGAGTPEDNELVISAGGRAGVAAADFVVRATSQAESHKTLSAAATFTLYGRANAGGPVNNAIIGGDPTAGSNTVIKAEFALL